MRRWNSPIVILASSRQKRNFSTVLAALNQNQSANDMDDKDQLAQLAEPWRFIAPPTIGDRLDLKASDSKWDVLRGFDSREQCEIGIELAQRDYTAGGGLNYQATLHGKCVPAPPH
jgi:hypothetical protein